jgi:hypothetical protein
MFKNTYEIVKHECRKCCGLNVGRRNAWRWPKNAQPLIFKIAPF